MTYRSPLPYVQIEDFPKYRVNKDGIVLGQAGRPLKARPASPSRKGNIPYLQVALYNESGRKDRAIHHLVLEAFIGPRPDGLEALHIDGNYLNNTVENLRWGTKADNGRDKVRHRPNCTCGLPLSGDNLMLVSNGVRAVRKCRECHNKNTLAGYHARKGKRVKRVMPA